MAKDNDNVYHIAGKLPKAPVEKRERPFGACDHIRGCHVIVDDVLRTVQCSKCEAYLDPVQVIIEQAHKYRSMKYRLYELQRLEEKYRKQEEKARERRLKKKNAG